MHSQAMSWTHTKIYFGVEEHSHMYHHKGMCTCSLSKLFSLWEKIGGSYTFYNSYKFFTIIFRSKGSPCRLWWIQKLRFVCGEIKWVNKSNQIQTVSNNLNTGFFLKTHTRLELKADTTFSTVKVIIDGIYYYDW